MLGTRDPRGGEEGNFDVVQCSASGLAAEFDFFFLLLWYFIIELNRQTRSSSSRKDLFQPISTQDRRWSLSSCQFVRVFCEFVRVLVEGYRLSLDTGLAIEM